MQARTPACARACAHVTALLVVPHCHLGMQVSHLPCLGVLMRSFVRTGGGSVEDLQNNRALVELAEAFVKLHIEQLDVDASHDWW